eukprot:1811318-Prymnesium_polylepis.1
MHVLEGTQSREPDLTPSLSHSDPPRLPAESRRAGAVCCEIAAPHVPRGGNRAVEIDPRSTGAARPARAALPGVPSCSRCYPSLRVWQIK